MSDFNSNTQPTHDQGGDVANAYHWSKQLTGTRPVVTGQAAEEIIDLILYPVMAAAAAIYRRFVPDTQEQDGPGRETVTKRPGPAPTGKGLT